MESQMSDAQPIGDVAKDVVNSDPSNGTGRPGKSSSAVSIIKRPATLGALGAVALAGIGIGVAATGGVGGSSTTATTVTTSLPTTTAAPAAAGATATSSSAPVVVPPPTLTPVQAVFTQSAFHTIYTENATPGIIGQTLSYAWSVSIPNDPECAAGFKGNTPQSNQATWYHADASQGGPCNHAGQDYGASGHPGTVTVVVSAGSWHCTATIYGTITQQGPTPSQCTRS
jgi:hypothetical protein